VLQNGFMPAIGESFTFLEYGSHSGSLFIHDRNIDGLTEHWVITYLPDHAVLAVAPGNVAIPDQASTLLLLMLSLFGLVGLQATYAGVSHQRLVGCAVFAFNRCTRRYHTNC
jgi:hypothetical protein